MSQEHLLKSLAKDSQQLEALNIAYREFCGNFLDELQVEVFDNDVHGEELVELLANFRERQAEINNG